MTSNVRHRAAVGIAVGGGAIVAVQTPAGAHAAHGPFPMPLWLFVYATVFALGITVLALRILWPSPRLAALATRGFPALVDRACRALGVAFRAAVLVVFAVTLAASWFGVKSTAVNLGPTALYVVFWVGMPLVVFVFGDVWLRANPLVTLARVLDRIARRDGEVSRATGWFASHWPAAIGLFAFAWTELAYHDRYSVQITGVFLGVYTGVMLIGAGWFGSAWLRTADGFAVFFSFVATLSPLDRVDGRLRLRWPGSGLAGIEARDGTIIVISVLLGAIGFDGMSQTSWWLDIAADRSPWNFTVVNTLGMLMCTAVVAAVFMIAARAVASLAGDDDRTSTAVVDRWVPILIPVVFGLFIAHSFSLLVIDGQAFAFLISDPFGRDWDLFGTADRLIEPDVVSAYSIAWVQVIAVVSGSVAAVVAIHDRAVARYDLQSALRSQMPLLAVVVVAAVGGLVVLL